MHGPINIKLSNQSLHTLTKKKESIQISKNLEMSSHLLFKTKQFSVPGTFTVTTIA